MAFARFVLSYPLDHLVSETIGGRCDDGDALSATIPGECAGEPRTCHRYVVSSNYIEKAFRRWSCAVAQGSRSIEERLHFRPLGDAQFSAVLQVGEPLASWIGP